MLSPSLTSPSPFLMGILLRSARSRVARYAPALEPSSAPLAPALEPSSKPEGYLVDWSNPMSLDAWVRSGPSLIDSETVIALAEDDSALARAIRGGN